MKVPTMTIGETEQDNELMKLREENEGLKEKCHEYDLQIERLTRQAEHAYTFTRGQKWSRIKQNLPAR